MKPILLYYLCQFTKRGKLHCYPTSDAMLADVGDTLIKRNLNFEDICLVRVYGVQRGTKIVKVHDRVSKQNFIQKYTEYVRRCK